MKRENDKMVVCVGVIKYYTNDKDSENSKKPFYCVLRTVKWF